MTVSNQQHPIVVYRPLNDWDCKAAPLALSGRSKSLWTAGDIMSRSTFLALFIYAFAASPSLAASIQTYDSNNKVVGSIIMQNQIAIKIGNSLVSIPDSAAGFTVQDTSNIQFYHATTDCSGQRYSDASGLPEPAQLNADTIYYAGTPTINLAIMSIEVFPSNANLGAPGQCVPFSGLTLFAGPVLLQSISALGFVAPFSVR